MKASVKRILAPILVLLTVVFFVWFVSKNPTIIEQLKQTSLLTIGLVIILYICVFGCLLLLLNVSLQLFKQRIAWLPNLLLNAYGSLANFFGPGQSGPAVRAAYLKLNHGIALKQYFFATLLYYAIFAAINGSIILLAAFSWWLSLLGILAGLLVLGGGVWWLWKRKSAKSQQPFNPRSVLRPLSFMFIITAAQIGLLVLIYFVQLHSFDPSITLSQVLIYTGAANLALFVSLTPGAIGFREAFLLFSQQLHHISTNTIIAANVLDRAIYIVFLALLFIVVLSLHAGKRLRIAQLKATATAEQAGQQ